MEPLSLTLPELQTEAKRLATSLTRREAGATLITLSGPLGAGKTAFTQALAEALGVRDAVTSPTFVLEKIYLLPVGGAFERLVHIDAYRLEKGSELAPLGFDELLQDAGNLIVLEWPERVQETLPEPVVRITLRVVSDTARALTYG